MRIWVSILVVVDWVQRHSPDSLDVWADFGFNPCCRGLGSKTTAALRIAGCKALVSILVVVDWVQRLARKAEWVAYITQVSILVVVDWVQRHVICGGFPCQDIRFQSLLSWIGFKDLTSC